MFLILAHQGGWDEIIYIAIPVIVFGYLLKIARKRARAEAEEEARAGNDLPEDLPVDPELPT